MTGFIGFMVVVMVIALGLGWVNLGRLVKRLIEQTLEAALQHPVTITQLRLNPLQGKLIVKGMSIANPAGFRSPNLMTAQTILIQAQPLSVFGPVLKISQIIIQNTQVTFEQQQLRNNVILLMSTLEDPKTQRERGDRRFQIGQVLIQQTNALIYTSLLGWEPMELVMPLPDITLDNVIAESVDGLVLSEVLRTLLSRIFSTVWQDAAKNLPQLRDRLPQFTDQLREKLPSFLQQFPFSPSP